MMDSTIKAQWIARLTDPDRLIAYDYLHQPGGLFDCLGLLCDIYLQAVYPLASGQGAFAGSLLNNIKTYRDNVVSQINTITHSMEFGPNFNLNNGVIDLYKSDMISPKDKKEIKTVWNYTVSEQISIDAVAAGIGILTGQYDTAVEIYRQFLASLTGPGGWLDATKNWKTDYTSVDTSDSWILSNDGTYYLIANYFDKLPEEVQVWSGLFTQDPTLEVTDAYGFHGSALHPGPPMWVSLNKIHDGEVQKNDDTVVAGGVARPYTMMEMAMLIEQQL